MGSASSLTCRADRKSGISVAVEGNEVEGHPVNFYLGSAAINDKAIGGP